MQAARKAEDWAAVRSDPADRRTCLTYVQCFYAHAMIRNVAVPVYATIQNPQVAAKSYADSTLSLDPPLDMAHRMLCNTLRGHGTLKLDADEVCEVLCVGLVFASGVAAFVAWGCAATEVEAEAATLVPWAWAELAADMLLAWAVLFTVDVISVGVAMASWSWAACA